MNMSKAERQAGALEGFADTLPAYGFNPKPLRDTAAHLRALDASHQRLVEALEQAARRFDDVGLKSLSDECRAALEQAKALS
jgi:hypothetical protein